MIRAPLLASARTTTQFLDIELTQREDGRDLDDTDARDFGGGASTGLGDATARGAASFTIGSIETGLDVSGDRALSGSMLPALAIVTRGATVSAATTAVREATVSARMDGESDLRCAVVRAPAESFRPASRMSQAAPVNTTSAATPTPLQTDGPTGARSGLVPHHRHDPTLSG